MRSCVSTSIKMASPTFSNAGGTANACAGWMKTATCCLQTRAATKSPTWCRSIRMAMESTTANSTSASSGPTTIAMVARIFRRSLPRVASGPTKNTTLLSRTGWSLSTSRKTACSAGSTGKSSISITITGGTRIKRIGCRITTEMRCSSKFTGRPSRFRTRV